MSTSIAAGIDLVVADDDASESKLATGWCATSRDHDLGADCLGDRRGLRHGAKVISVSANLAWLVPGGVGGSEEYTTRLLASVVRATPSDIALEIVASRQLQAVLSVDGVAAVSALSGVLWATVRYRILAESTRVHRTTRNADIVHHFGGRLPAVRNPRAILTIHDLQPLEMPANFSLAKRQYSGMGTATFRRCGVVDLHAFGLGGRVRRGATWC